jgi:hypothetical protein
MKNSSKGFNDMISCYENFIDKIKVYMGFSDIEESICYYDTIELSNDNLASQIDNYNEEITRFESFIHEINLQKRQSECY